MTETRQILNRLAAADRAHQKEVGGHFLLRCVKFVCAFVLVAFVGDVALHLNSGWRLGLLLALVGGVLVLAGIAGWLAFVRKNRLEHIARFLESRDPALGSKLINLLQLRGQADDTSLAPLTRELARLAVEDYTTGLRATPLEELARTDALRRHTWRAAWALLIFAAVLAAGFRVSVVEFARFADPYGDHPPYSFTRLEIVEPAPTGTNVLYGKGFVVRVKASGHLPKEVFLTAHPPEHPEQAIMLPMFDQGGGRFHQMLDNVRTELVLTAHTKDRLSLSKQSRLGVVLTPQLERAFVQVAPPAYTGLRPEEKPYAFKGVQALVGSEVRFRLQSNRPLREGWLEISGGEGAPQRIALAKSAENEVAGKFAARESGRLRFSLVDVDGIPSQGDCEGALTVTFDLPPEIRIAEPERDAFVALDFKLKAQVEANDDYGLRFVRFHRGLNGVYSAPKVSSYEEVVGQASHLPPSLRASRLQETPAEATERDVSASRLSNPPGETPGGTLAGGTPTPLAQAGGTNAPLHLPTVIRNVSETTDFDFAGLGVQPGDVLSFFAEAVDTAPEPHLARSQTVRLKVISVEDYNDFLREQTDLADAEAKYAALQDDLRELIEEQKKLGETAEKLQAQLSKADPAKRDALTRELDGLLAKQNELNQKLNQHAGRMENFVRENPVYDVEKELQELLKSEAADIRKSTRTNDAAARDIAQRSSPPDSARQLSPDMLADFKRASDEQVERLGGVEKDAEQQIAKTLQDMSTMQELMKDFNAFESLYQAQQELTAQAQAYNRAGELSREDQLALKELAATEKQVDDLLGALEQKLREDADAAEKLFPKAAKSGRTLADKIDELRLQTLARQATGKMLAGDGEQSYASADRLRAEMEKLFSDCQGGGNCPSSNELDNYLKLQRQMKSGNNFAQMNRSRKFGRVGKEGQGFAMGRGEGQMGSSGYAVMDGSKINVMGNEQSPSRNRATATQTSRAGKGAGELAGANAGGEADKADVVKGLNPVNRQSGAVTSEATIEEYNELVENYFKTITTRKQP